MNVMQAPQGEERGGQTPGGVRVGLDFFGTFLHQGKKYNKKGVLPLAQVFRFAGHLCL
jgi:hypothetical protein